MLYVRGVLTMPKTVVLLNSPPHSGKDTIANLMVEELQASKQEFKEALYEETAKHYDVNIHYFTFIATSRKYKDNLLSVFSKKPKSLGFGMTPREALIHVSEEIIKPRHGIDYFGKRAAEKLTEGLNVLSDGGGWWEELTPVSVAADKTIICRLYRHGFTFDGDSRQYYDTDTLPDSMKDSTTICDIHLEDGKPQAAIDSIKTLLRK